MTTKRYAEGDFLIAVDIDTANLQLLCNQPGLGRVLRPNTCSESQGGVVNLFDNILFAGPWQ
jgi:hypothetical protein